MSTSLRYLLYDFWEKDTDPFINSLFATQNPWTYFTVIVATLYLIKKTELSMKSEKEPIWVKPTMLILYGLNFGINGAGMLLALAATSNGKDCFRCVDRSVLNVLTTSMRYLGYAYICTLLFEFWMKTLEARMHRIQSNGRLLRDIVWMIVSFVALKFIPVGYYAFCPFAHCMMRTLDYGIKVLQSASSELKFIDPSWKSRQRYIEIFGWTAICAQQYWVYSSLQCDLSWVNLLGSVAAGFQAGMTLMGM